MLSGSKVFASQSRLLITKKYFQSKFLHFLSHFGSRTLIQTALARVTWKWNRLSWTILNTVPNTGYAPPKEWSIIKLHLGIGIIEIGLELAPFVFFKFFSAFEHVKSLLIMGPNNTKNSSLVWFSHN